MTNQVDCFSCNGLGISLYTRLDSTKLIFNYSNFKQNNPCHFNGYHCIFRINEIQVGAKNRLESRNFED